MKRNFLIGLIGAILIIGCAAPTNSQKDETSGTWKWPTSTPEQQKLDSSRLEELVKIIREGKKFPRLDSLLIVRDGYLVVEEYFTSYNADIVFLPVPFPHWRWNMMTNKKYSKQITELWAIKEKIYNETKTMDFKHYTDYLVNNIKELKVRFKNKYASINTTGEASNQ